ncbi:hypothetical protein [Tenacibaculum sp. SDUM215027]|uniref:hypothetical protein n=1 Tax=Tenacibaculum sp. SDUM215027 TaxID=3422596 RepID=UPI003D31A65C
MNKYLNLVMYNSKKKIILFIVLISCTSFSQSKNIPDRILTYGLSNYNKQKAMEFVGKKWDIEVYPVAGCMVSQELIDSVKTVHSKLWKKMDSIHGMDSKKRFKKETIAEMKRIGAVQKIFNSDRDIKRRIRKIKRRKGKATFNLENISNNGKIYYWTVYSFEDKNNPEYKWKPEFKVGVNLVKKNTTIIELK